MSSRKRATARAHKQARPRNWILGGGVAVIVVAMIAAVALNRGGNSNSASAGPQTRPVTVTGTALPTYDQQAATDAAVGKAIPTLQGQNFAGEAVTVESDGKAKVLLFAAHWCPHCQREIPLLAPNLRSNPLPANVEMFTISTAVDSSAPNYPPSKWLSGVSWPTPIIADDANSSAARAFGLSAYPYFVFVGPDNKVVARTSGEIPIAQFRALVNQLAQQ
jgi:cytochrome c biogenesis protein CcmG/thiol:disulfide interchange protein DsbE